ncbi:MAG: glycerophosphodiester phosphodiesterase family protein [Eubacteriales bacterium]|nr:glycerophosphodiester phosphodiesterase family protein [Eubacteriales bacterium]
MSVLLWILLILMALFLLYLWMIAPARNKPDASALKGWLYAHRGLHDGNHAVAENSLEAFRRAIENGYGMELDVQLTADNRLVVFHDANLKRVCGVDVNLYTLTYDQLMEHPLPDGSKIPLFSEVLALVNGRAPMIVEVKYHHQVECIAAATYEALKPYQGAYCIESFHPLAVRYFKKNAPEVVRGELAYGGKWNRGETNGLEHFCMKHLLPLCLTRPHFIAYSFPDDHSFAMWMMKRVYKPLLAAWTIRDQATLDKVMGVYDFPIFELFTPKKKD